MDYIDTILDIAAAESFGPAWLRRNGQSPLPTVLGGAADCNNRNPRWSPEERRFLAESIGLMSDEQIAEALGRTSNAIKIKRQRWSLPAHSKRPGWYTGNRVAKLLKVDIHNIMALVDRGLLPAERIPGRRGILAIPERTLFRWAVNTDNWIYFNPERVTHRRLRRLIELKRARWGDEWWTIGQIAAHWDVTCSGVHRLIYAGELPAVRWGNWRVLRSDAIQHPINKGKGHNRGLNWSPASQAFIILAAALGLSASAIAAYTRRYDGKQIAHRLSFLAKRGGIQTIIYSTPIQYDQSRRLLHIELRYCAHRFPALVNGLRTLRSGELPDRRVILLVRAYLGHLLDWHHLAGPRMISVDRWTPKTIRKRLQRMVTTIQNAGIDPFEGI